MKFPQIENADAGDDHEVDSLKSLAGKTGNLWKPAGRLLQRGVQIVNGIRVQLDMLFPQLNKPQQGECLLAIWRLRKLGR